jgi:hypothetical protein
VKRCVSLHRRVLLCAGPPSAPIAAYTRRTVEDHLDEWVRKVIEVIRKVVERIFRTEARRLDQRFGLGAAFTFVVSSITSAEVRVRLLTGEPFIQLGIFWTTVELFPICVQNSWYFDSSSGILDILRLLPF